MQNKNLCQKCGMRFRHEIRMYDPNALYLDTKSPALSIKTEKGAPVGCFYCFPFRRVTKGFLYLSDSEPQKKEVEVVKQSAPPTSKMLPFGGQWNQFKANKSSMPK